MKPGDRVELLKKLAIDLATRDSDDVDLILRQFGFTWSNRWEGTSPYAYALEHLEQGTDDRLLALFEYVFAGQVVPGSTAVETEGAWTPGFFRLFVSHINTDRHLVGELKGILGLVGIDAFVAHEDIEPTKEWQREIETALETCHALVAILTPQFHSSFWTDQEIGYCIKRRVLIVPVMIGTTPYGFIGRYQGLQGARKTAAEIVTDIVTLLIDNPLTAGQMASAILTYFEESPSFAEARRRIDVVARIKAWTPELLQRLESSIERNTQIRDAYHVPDRIRRIVEQNRG